MGQDEAIPRIHHPRQGTLGYPGEAGACMSVCLSVCHNTNSGGGEKPNHSSSAENVLLKCLYNYKEKEGNVRACVIQKVSEHTQKPK